MGRAVNVAKTRKFFAIGRSRKILLAAGALFSIGARADETCGLPSAFDVIFANGFEVASPAVLPKPTLARPNSATVVPTITITSPAPGAAITDNKVDVVGTFTGPDNTGIVVGDALAYAHSGQFVVAAVPITSGSNTLTATATTIDAQSASASVSVTGQDNPAALILTPSAKAGFAPFTVTFLGKLSIGTIQSVAIDYDGDGNDDYTGSSLPSPFNRTYAAPGVYAVRLAIHTNEGQTYIATRRVVIQNLATVKTTVCGVFGHFRQNLAANQIATATQALGEIAKDRYTAFLNGLGPTNAVTVATQLGTIANGIFGVDGASLIVAATTNSELQGFPVTIARGDDGVWRITSM